ncbi:uncharacterized protein LOC143857702 [Tasmannia lanceolata]|uniref:uncharacterized protein LOC143857702 n=1 Tax=Tasmannia lanceolata TaxID=3420 RepID=UPI004064BD8A
MARATRVRRRLSSRQYRSTPYPLPSRGRERLEKAVNPKKSSKTSEKKDWEDGICSVCMDFPHNAVLLLCSSHDKGCRPYICATSYRYSNCLNQFIKAYTKVISPPHEPSQVRDGMWHESRENLGFRLDRSWVGEKSGSLEPPCPLCRGQVKGWTVVEGAREYLNAKKRSCIQDECSFVGTYKQLRKHVPAQHPRARPHKVDPILEQKWRRLEREREHDDVMSTIRSSMPGAIVLGDYVIERSTNNNSIDMGDEGEVHEGGDHDLGVDEGNWLNVLFLLQAFGPALGSSSRFRRLERGFRTLEDGGSVPPPIATSRATVAVTSEGEDDTPARRVRRRLMGTGNSERRRRRSRRRTVMDDATVIDDDAT